MPQLFSQYLQYQFQYSKEESRFLYGEYELQSLSPDTPKELLDLLGNPLTIKNLGNCPEVTNASQYCIGMIYYPDGSKSEVLPLTLTFPSFLYSCLGEKPNNHLLLIEYSRMANAIGISVCPNKATSLMISALTQGFLAGNFNEKIYELSEKLITIENYNHNNI